MLPSEPMMKLLRGPSSQLAVDQQNQNEKSGLKTSFLKSQATPVGQAKKKEVSRLQ